jgi:hypothetical protein
MGESSTNHMTTSTPPALFPSIEPSMKTVRLFLGNLINEFKLIVEVEALLWIGLIYSCFDIRTFGECICWKSHAVTVRMIVRRILEKTTA